MAVKENQKGLYEATEELFRRSSTREKNKLPQSEHAEKKENVHGRDESRCCRVLYLEKEVSFFPKEDWPEAHALIRIRSERKMRSAAVPRLRRVITSPVQKNHPKNLTGVKHMTWAGDQQTKSSSGSYYPWQPSFAFF